MPLLVQPTVGDDVDVQSRKAVVCEHESTVRCVLEKDTHHLGRVLHVVPTVGDQARVKERCVSFGGTADDGGFWTSNDQELDDTQWRRLELLETTISNHGIGPTHNGKMQGCFTISWVDILGISRTLGALHGDDVPLKSLRTLI